MRNILFVLLGYLSGSVLYARIFSEIFKKENMIENSRDKNPGAANAFQYGGFWCGLLTLTCDIAKGFLPVFLFMRWLPFLNPGSLSVAFVLAAPVIGHVFPLFYGFRGGKGIAVTFGCLLGILPIWRPFAILALWFIFFSVVLRITPHYHRTLAAYFASLICMACVGCPGAVLTGFALITVMVCVRMAASPEEKEKMRVRFL